ncbi:oligomeric golgi complex component, COG2-domain-containing protein [Fimicolochytrium jonesii]|uniref:oligomeric golgi complex component, COG2-domain-containing protein n=1 Tax=Fimicolochytrium jonesii TaxID=1396493 RepID=UPI0022FF3499|nr:oligomeric golgi complex component, COG2-domain-containing protein [Fimicolochytrium jonesii]KAI8820382.1 oligomeric golgi complex component, COG2-domain-containing protein [Fimicolochytrium jonesii]
MAVPSAAVLRLFRGSPSALNLETRLSFDASHPPPSALRSASFTHPPISFDRASFTGPSFSPEEFLGDRRHIALDELKKELQQSLRDLKTELVELINLDYADFIDLSTKLVGVDEMISGLGGPLEKIEGSVQAVRDALNDGISQLEEELENRAELREKKVYLQLFVNIHESLEKLDGLLKMSNEGHPRDGDGNEEALAEGKLIERVANEYTQLRYLISRASKTPFVQKIDKRVAHIKDTLTQSLSRSLKLSYERVMSPNSTAVAENDLSQILRTYVSVDRADEAEQIFSESVMAPFLDKVVNRQNLVLETRTGATPKTDIASARNPLENMYDAILAFVAKDCAKVVAVTTKAFHGTKANLHVDSIWVAVATAIMKKIPFIFNPGIPEVFHKNYSCTIHFVSEMESLCKTSDVLGRFRAHSITSDFLKRWQLPVYFQIRFREIATDFEDATTATDDLNANVNVSEGLIMTPSSALMICINLCWDPSVYLPGLAHRFWKLTLQLVARYVIWVKETLQLDISANPVEAPDVATSPTPGGRVSTSTAFPAEQQSLKTYMYFYNDLRNIISQVANTFNDVIRTRIPGGSRTEQVLQDSLRESLSPLQDMLPLLTQRVCQVLVQRCFEPLYDNVQAITRQYRATNKEPPSKASYFIPTIFTPMLAFFEENGNLANSVATSEWTANVVDNVTSKYAATLAKLVSDNKWFEDYNRRMKKSSRLRPTTAAGENAMSDGDKIRLQLYLDVEQYITEIQGLGVNPATLESGRELRQITDPFAELLKK